MAEQAQDTTVDIRGQVRDLLLAYERLDGTWRHRLDVGANEKLVLAFLSAHGVATAAELCELTFLDHDEMVAAILALSGKDLIDSRVNVDDVGNRLVLLTKRGLRARMLFERVFDDLASLVEQDRDAATGATRRFIEGATEVFARHSDRDPD